jgi:large subunit ribosomal protein L24
VAAHRGGLVDHHLRRGTSMVTRSIQPRRQRKALYNAHTAERRRRMAVALSRELRQRYGRRQIPVRKGDTVRILSGSFVGREERVARVVRRDYAVVLDNVTGTTGAKKLKPLTIRLTHLLLTRLNLSDPWRRRVLKVPDSELPSSDSGEPASETREAAPKASATPPVKESTK